MKIFHKIFNIFALVFIPISFASAQFGEDVRVSDTTGGFFGCVLPWIVSGTDDVLFAVWSSDYTVAFDNHIYFSKSTDMGNNWVPSIKIDNIGEACVYPCLTVDTSGNLYCAWVDLRMEGDQIHFSKSTDAGNTWIPSVRVDDAPDNSNLGNFEITVNGNELMVVWADCRTDWRIRFSKSTDGGNTWSSSIEISGAFFSKDPAIETCGDTVYVTYSGGPNNDIHLTQSIDRGLTWQSMGIVNDVTSGSQTTADIGITSNGILSCDWYDSRTGSWQVYFSKSTDGGNSWATSILVSDIPSSNPGQRINVACLDENCIFCVWQDFRYGSWDIFFAMSEDGGTTWSENILVNDTAFVDDAQMVSSLCFDNNGYPCVVWGDSRGPVNFHIYFDKGIFDTGMPLVVVLFPNGGEIFQSGDTCSITWIATDNIGVDSIDIFYSADAGGSWDVITTGEPNDSTYEWIIPDTPSDSCLIKILAYDPSLNIGEDQSDSLFSIAPSGIEENISSLDPIILFQVTPNPFKEMTEITLKMIDDRWKMEDASLNIYDASGRLIKEFNLQSAICNLQSVKWSGTDQLDHSVPSGVYFMRLKSETSSLTRKVILLR